MARSARSFARTLAGLLATVLVVGACSAAPVARETPVPSAGGAAAPAATATGPKTVVVGVQREPASFDPDLSGAASSTTGGALSARRIPHDELVARTPQGTLEPRLAQELPSFEKGTWQVNADGTMDLTWKLRPNIKWHDGTPFTSHDLLFTFQVRRDPSLVLLGSGGSGRPELMGSVSAPDPQTLVVHWNALYNRADLAAGLTPLPEHFLGDLYRSRDVDALVTSRYLTTEFVGLGAYKLTHWEPGSYLEFAGFPDYYLGRPGFDKLVLQIVPDANTLVANLLAGSLDVVLPPTIDIEAAFEVQRRWEGTGNQVRFDTGAELEQLDLQHRPEFAVPRNGLTNRTVRQAFYHAIDRQTLTDVMTHGMAPVADSYYPTDHPLRQQVESAIPQFPFDLNRARQLLSEAGWLRGTDGVLTYQPTGDHFDVELMIRSGNGPEKEANIIADGWKALGAQVSFSALSQVQSNDAEYLAKRKGPYLTAPTGEAFYDSRLHSSGIGRPETRWTGPNRGGYNNPRVDALLDRLVVTIDPQAQVPLHRELVQEQIGDIAIMPLYWVVSPTLLRKGVTGPQMAYNVTTYRMIDWRPTD